MVEVIAEQWLNTLLHADRLSDLEKEEIKRIARNLSAEESATEQGQSWETVRSRRKSICKKLEVRNTRDILYSMLEFSCSSVSSSQ
jgi:DNA-binding CsgD family transcriptional regulator